MQVTARVDYALRALVELAAAPDQLTSRDELATAQGIPPRYLESILLQLRQLGIVIGQRGAAGGYRLSRPAEQITVAEVSRAVDGPLAVVQGLRPEQIVYDGNAKHVGELWIGLRAAVRMVMENVTIAQLLSGTYPDSVRTLLMDPEAWLPH